MTSDGCLGDGLHRTAGRAAGLAEPGRPEAPLTIANPNTGGRRRGRAARPNGGPAFSLTASRECSERPIEGSRVVAEAVQLRNAVL
ncbi:hypothetical protein NDU88_005553 [Pleurodeles waltl]|uniref:Uncharacterized protein n=1 Tax=Pleurodeles waltl TaxID=8319 RepID=A0AAV7SLY9_PLEWA|nr:hypothetical protein NDU88_005553 [Pleurodeles waltl]